MSDISNRTKNVVRMVVEPKLKRLIQELKEILQDDNYFSLVEQERLLLSKKLAISTINETSKLFVGSNRFNDPNFIYELSIHNLSSLIEIFLEQEMYGICQMLTDAITILNDDIQSMDRK